MLHVRMLYSKIQPTGKWSEPMLLQVAPTQDFSRALFLDDAGFSTVHGGLTALIVSTDKARPSPRALTLLLRWLLGRLKPSLCTGAELSPSCKRREKVSPRRVNTLVDERGLRHQLRLRTPDEPV
ncbi:hypothetical protein HPB51_013950 [Rhipicephalus microplus]|uniref:Uncharacterized protein n=1 Tax=Rhipicephalus microplus TaxID=6941 RepID=A0A9J6DGY2_RHIMP|nr:hypothetical protein HPB51_013950 [Rhipicephalus microplus]